MSGGYDQFVPARRPGPARVAAAVTEQADAIADWLPTLAESDWSAPTSLPGWSVSHLALHLAQTLRTISTTLPRHTNAAPITVAAYVEELKAAAEEIRDREIDAGTEQTPRAVIQAYAEQLAAAKREMELPAPDVVDAPRGPLRSADFLATRAIELIVHADDLARTLPENPPPLRRNASAVAVRALADVLATRAPGRSVEVRIPPYAAVQCVPGPRHTRGTPPTVIETDPVTWIRLSAGRMDWAAALESGAVTASGERSDLSVYLPLLS
jgi:uncharacterized protein (TIGR03083 family)